MQQVVLRRRYKIVQVVGTGRTATVYQAQDLKEHRTVAIKALKATVFTDRKKLELVKREVKTAMALKHANIAQTFDYWEDKGALFVVTEFVNGVTIAELLESRRVLSVNEALTIIQPILRALDYAHRQNQLHLDLSLTNIMLAGNGQPKILDFGLARANLINPLDSYAYFWSPVNCAPEQFNGLANQTSDLYALGTILYEMLSGQPIFEGESVTVINKINFERPPALFYINPSFSAEIDDLVMQAIARNPAERFLSAPAMYEAVVNCLEKNGGKISIVSLVGKFSGITPIPSTPAPLPKPAVFRAKNLTSQKPFVIGLGAALILLFGVVLVLVIFPNNERQTVKPAVASLIVTVTPRPATATPTLAPTNTALPASANTPVSFPTPIPTPTLPASIAVQTAIAQNCNTLYDEAGKAFDSRNWANAILLYEQVLTTLPTCKQDEVRSRVAGANFELEQFDKAIAGYAYLEQNFPNFRPDDTKRDLAEAYCRLGMSMFKNQEVEKVLPPLGECVKRNPQFPLAAIALDTELSYRDGRDAARSKNWAVAVDKLAKAYAFDEKFRDTAPILFDAYMQYGGQLVAQSKFKEATAIYDRARNMRSAPQVDPARADKLFQETGKR